VKLRVPLAILLAGATGCGVLVGLQESYSSAPGDGGIADDGGTAGDGGTASDGTASSDAASDSGFPITGSCKLLLAAAPATLGRNGLYTIDPDGPGPNAPVQVFCEMSLDQGGWTLIARSASSAAPFGWSSNTGTPADLTVPYSLDVVTLGLVFSQLLVADADGKSLDAATRAYRVPLPVSFLGPYANAGARTAGVTTVFGNCNPANGPEMLRWVGYTARSDAFFLRDVDGVQQVRGLHPTGFDMAYADCNRGGSLDGVAGLLYVR
jgi:hypothetical protein